MLGWKYTKFKPQKKQNAFEKLLEILKDLLLQTSGDMRIALSWLTEIDAQYKLTNKSYGIADFIQELVEKKYIEKTGEELIQILITGKLEQAIRKKAFKDVFGQIKRAKSGNHSMQISGSGDELTSNLKPFEYGDSPENIAFTESIRNAHVHHGIEDFKILDDDLILNERYFQSQTSSVLMIDISHSMILYGEDRITPAKQVALGLSEYIRTRFPKDTLDIIVFGDDAWKVELKDLPYLEVGPYHTNTVAGLELAIDILRKRRAQNKQIFLITDGKPTCIKVGKKYYKNPYGLDRKIVTRTLTLGAQCRKMGIHISTFMIAHDPNLVSFVEEFTKVSGGKSFYSDPVGLGDFIYKDYKSK